VSESVDLDGGPWAASARRLVVGARPSAKQLVSDTAWPKPPGIRRLDLVPSGPRLRRARVRISNFHDAPWRSPQSRSLDMEGIVVKKTCGHSEG